MLLVCVTFVVSCWRCIRPFSESLLSLPISPYSFHIMMFIAFHDRQCDAVSRIPVADRNALRNVSDNRIIAFSLAELRCPYLSPAQCCSPLLYYPCRVVTRVSGCGQLSVLPNCLESFPSTKTHRPHSVRVTGPPDLGQHSYIVAYASNRIPLTSHLSDKCQPVQLFIKSIRNTTISIHIDSTSSISDLKHLMSVHDGIPPCDHRLMHRGHELREDALLSGLDVDGSTITCLLRVLGGNLYGSIPFYWWFGFSRSYEDGRAGEEGRSCHVLSEIEFEGACPVNWYSEAPLSDWEGCAVHSGIVFIDCFDVAR